MDWLDCDDVEVLEDAAVVFFDAWKGDGEGSGLEYSEVVDVLDMSSLSSQLWWTGVFPMEILERLVGY